MNFPISWFDVKDHMTDDEYGIEPRYGDIPKVFIDGAIPTTKDEVKAELTYVSKTESFHAYIKIKCQGSSALYFPKKNFTIKMFSDVNCDKKYRRSFRNWGVNQHKWVLKANYVDHTHARNIACANLWAQTVSLRNDYDTLPEELRSSPNNGAIDGFPIKTYLNGVYQGIYTWNIPKDDWTFGMDENNPKHLLLQSGTNDSSVTNPCLFTELWGGVDDERWSVEIGSNTDDAKVSLNNLISCVIDTDDETFKNTVGDYLDIQSAIDYMIHMNNILGCDNFGKNILLASYDAKKWYFSAYDMDLVLGQSWIGCPLPLSTKWAGLTYNRLFVRLHTVFHNEVVERHRFLRNTVYTKHNMIGQIERVCDCIGPELYAEDIELFSEISEVGGTVKFLREFITGYEIYADFYIELPVYHIVNGIHTFSDDMFYPEMTVEVTEYKFITVTTPNNALLTHDWGGINISNITLNTTDVREDNMWHCPELFSLQAGDVVRFVVWSNKPLYASFKLASSTGDYGRVILVDSEYTPCSHFDVTKVMENDFSVGAIFTRIRNSATFNIELYVNDVRYI